MMLQRRRSTTRVLMLLTLASTLLVGVLFYSLSLQRNASATDESGRLITVYDRGEEKVFLTEQPTIGDALKEQGFILDPRDAVEPALDENLVASDYHVNIYRARPVTVVDGSTRQRVMTAYQTAEKIVADAGIILNPEDRTTLSRSDDFVVDGAGLQLTIDRATPVTVNLFGAITQVRTQAGTVGDFLKEKALSLSDQDKISESDNTPIVSGMTIRIWREGRQTVSVNEPLPFSVEKIEDADRPIGYREVKSEGKDGVRSVTYEIFVENGVEVSRHEIASLVTTPAQSQIEVIGAKVVLSVTLSADKTAIMTAGGVAPEDQQYAAFIINNENALWCAIRWQGTRGCASDYYVISEGAEDSKQIGYGLCQATPGNKMASAGADWRTNVVTQMKWCHSYAIGRYGSWEAAYRFKAARGWW